jgi:hypothetical protein
MFNLNELGIDKFLTKEIDKKIKDFYNTRKETKKNKKPIIFDNIFKCNVSFLSKTFGNERFNLFNNSGFKIGMISLAPHNISGKNNCIHADKCKFYCHGHQFEDKQFVKNNDKKQIIQKIIKTTALLTPESRNKSMNIICREIASLIKNNYNPVIRLNGYSDIIWEDDVYDFTLEEITINYFKKIKDDLFEKVIRLHYCENILGDSNLDNFITKNIIKENLNSKEKYSLFEIFEGILFYDYTKYTSSHRNNNRNGKKKYKNYHLSYSYCENIFKNIKKMDKINDLCIIVNESIKDELLKKYKNDKELNVIDGDLYDVRWLDTTKIKNNKKIGFVILLKAVESTKLKKEHMYSQSNEENRILTTAKNEEDFNDIIKFLKNNLYEIY